MKRNGTRVLIGMVALVCVLSGCSSNDELPEMTLQATDADFAAAIMDGDELKVREMLDVNPDLATQANGAGETPLHYAARANDMAIARLLIEKGASIYAKNDSEEVPAQVAANSGASPELLKLLTGEAGAH